MIFGLISGRDMPGHGLQFAKTGRYLLELDRGSEDIGHCDRSPLGQHVFCIVFDNLTILKIGSSQLGELGVGLEARIGEKSARIDHFLTSWRTDLDVRVQHYYTQLL
jgi:hypothetical protein